MKIICSVTLLLSKIRKKVGLKLAFILGVHVVVSTFSCVSSAQDKEVVNLGATITGNQEQPKVLYIVPWKQTKDDTILSQGLESRLVDVFDHVERTEHKREIEFFETLVDAEEQLDTNP